MKELYTEFSIGNKLQSLTVSMFSNGRDEFPFLKVKANEARHLLPCVLQLSRDWTRVGNEHDLHRLSAIQHLCRFYAACSSPNTFLSPEEIRVATESCRAFLLHYSWLTSESIGLGLCRWQMTVKFHYFAHAPEQLRYLNPRHGSCYAAESFIGKLAKIAHSASFGKSMERLGPFLMSKVRLAYVLRLRKAWRGSVAS